MARRPKRSDNGGPPLDDYKGPPWGKGDAYIFLAWQTAHAQGLEAAKPRRDADAAGRAERLGLTYEEYTLEILERGRHLSEQDDAAHRRDQGRPAAAGASDQAGAAIDRKFRIDLAVRSRSYCPRR